MDNKRKLAEAEKNKSLDKLLSDLDESDAKVKIDSIRKLAFFRGDRVLHALSHIAKARYEERPEVRIAALEALSSIQPVEEFVTALEDFVAGENRKVMSAARSMMKELDPEGWTARLVKLGALDHQAICAYGIAREVTAIPLLTDFLEEKRLSGEFIETGWWGKVYAAVCALEKIGGDDARRTLLSLLENIDKLNLPSKSIFKEKRIEKIRVALKRALGKNLKA